MELLSSLASACLGRDLVPRERAALGVALVDACRDQTVPTVPMVVEALLSPSVDAARSLRTELRDLLEDGRDVALELRRLVHGDLWGMFDGPTTPGLDLSAPLVVLDLSALYSSTALGVLMACATAWLQAALARTAVAVGGGGPIGSGRGRFFLVVDEAWAILSNLGVARWLQSSWKLSRAFGVSNVAVLHRVSDLRSVGASDSEQVALAQGLLADSETRVVYAQAPGELEAASELLSLSATETELLPQLRRGVALWKVGQRSFLVQHRLERDRAPDRRHRRGHGGWHGAVTDVAAVVLPVALGGALVAGISYGDGSRLLSRRRGPGGTRRGARWGRRRDLRSLLVGARTPPVGRLLLGVLPGLTRSVGVAVEPAQSLVVVGPTQSGKTTSLAVPAILGWRGPVVAASVKSDLLRDTAAACQRRGQVWCIDPTGCTGAPASSWSPLPGCTDWRHACRVAADLCETAKVDGTTADGEFWYATAAKLLAPLLLAAARATGAWLTSFAGSTRRR